MFKQYNITKISLRTIVYKIGEFVWILQLNGDAKTTSTQLINYLWRYFFTDRKKYNAHTRTCAQWRQSEEISDEPNWLLHALYTGEIKKVAFQVDASVNASVVSSSIRTLHITGSRLQYQLSLFVLYMLMIAANISARRRNTCANADANVRKYVYTFDVTCSDVTRSFFFIIFLLKLYCLFTWNFL